MRRIAVIAMAAALPLAGCASNAPQPRPARPTAPIAGQGAVSAATYVVQAASIDLFVIRSSELARSRARDGRVQSFAGRMIAAHQGLASQLSFAGRRLDLLPSAALLPRHQAMLDELNSSGDFDRAYVRLQRAIHGAALSLHRDFAARGSSPTLRPVAANAAEVERSHLQMLRSL